MDIIFAIWYGVLCFHKSSAHCNLIFFLAAGNAPILTFLHSFSLLFSSQQIANGLWPTTWSNLLAAVVLFGAMLYATDFYKLSSLQPIAAVLWKVTYLLHLDEAYPYNFRLIVVSVLAGVVFFIVLLYLRQYTLRMLLAYRGWMCKYQLHFCLITF